MAKNERQHAGYGDLTNLIRMEKVWMVVHKEGSGLDGESPMREVKTFFDSDGKFILRDDVFKRMTTKKDI